LKPLEHTAEAIDSISVQYETPYADAVAATDTGRISRLEFSEYAFDYFSEDYIDMTVPTEVILETW
jgi:hypothetical protein